MLEICEGGDVGCFNMKVYEVVKDWVVHGGAPVWVAEEEKIFFLLFPLPFLLILR